VTQLRSEPLAVLLVEDNPADADLTCETLEANAEGLDVRVAADGMAALEQLRGAEPPDIVFLDLNLPRKSGHEVLREIRSDEALRRIPVVVLTSSSALPDVSRSYDLGANSYVTKPGDLETFQEVVGETGRFWLGVARLPT